MIVKYVKTYPVIQLGTGFSTLAHLFLKNSIKISFIIKECPKEILIKLANLS